MRTLTPEQRRARVAVRCRVMARVACPHCDAAIGARCVGARGKVRRAPHRERVKAAARQGGLRSLLKPF